MTYTEELLSKADAVIPRATLEDFNNDSNSKVMIDVRQHEELQASGTVEGAIHIPKGVIEFRLNNNDEISFDTSVYVFCAVGVRSAIAGYNLKKVGYQKVFNLVGFQDILDQGAEKQSLI
ncbi:rhodanese-like domain-containing protein [Pseudomonadota bacterium]|nr:rhodanese-like domain-containing protein [Pseudomonadota bacterium]|tara:strand:+ start:497 stop:856 length:360 start_codon:yes stop_codon:yes gene_type:complete